MQDTLKEWKLYEAGIKYHESLMSDDKGYYEQIDVNIAFANGDQWRNVKADNISKPMIPIIQKAKQHIIANLTSSDISATIAPLEYNTNGNEEKEQSDIETTDITNAEIRNLLERLKFEFKVREGLSDAFDMGDMCLHSYWDKNAVEFKGADLEQYKGKIEAELVDGPNVLFGNANNPNPQVQPYIIIVGRDLATNLREEAKEYKEKNTSNIQKDIEYNYQAGDAGKIELEEEENGKALYIIYYTKDKKTGTIKASKCVRNAYIYKDIDTKLTRYPIAFMNYRKQKNQYHGRAGATGLISNQIAVNKLLAMVQYSVMKTAFPTLVYDADRIAAPTNEIGVGIGIKNLNPNENIGNVARYLEVGQVSNQVMETIRMITDYTKEMLGINDAAVGNVNPDNTSAMALAEKLSAVPLENVRSNLYELTEQFVDNLIDMISVKYGTRPVVITDKDTKVITMYDFNRLQGLNISKRIDVGAIGYASELSMMKELRDLLELGAINVVEYLERMPENRVPKVKELIENIKDRLALQSAEERQENESKWEQMLAFIETLPVEIQEELKKLPDSELEAAVQQLMEQAPQMEEQQASSNLNQAIGQIV